MSFACLHIPNFPVQAVVRSEPEMCFRGVVIIEGKSESVIAANQTARDAGVQLGMIRLQVSQLPGIEIRPRSRAQEEAAHAALLDLSFSFSPRVEDTAADTITLDLDGLERVCGTPEIIAQKIVHQAAELGLDVNVAIACNPDTALHAARGFPGITLINSGATSERLGPLPVSFLAPSEEILETLNRWGIRTFKALAGLPTAELSERLGQPGVQLQKLARGAWLRPLIPVQPSLHFEEVMELEYAEEELEPLSFILGRMLGQLCARLSARGLAANELRLMLDLAGFEKCINITPSPPAPLPQGGEGRVNLNCSPHPLEEERKASLNFSPHPLEEERKASLNFNPRPLGGEGGTATRDRVRGFSTSHSIITDPVEPERLAKESSSKELPTRPTSASPKYERTLRLPVPMRDPTILLKLLQLNLGAHPPQAPIRKITITAEPAKPRVAQGGLFAPISPDPEKLEITLARIGALIGAKNSGSPELLDTHRPVAFGMSKFNPLSAGVACFSQGRKRLACNAGRRPALPETKAAVRTFRPPLPAQVETREGFPVRVFFSGIRGDVISVTGPWRSTGDWWTEESWQQDEWDVEIRMPLPQRFIAFTTMWQAASGSCAVVTIKTTPLIQGPPSQDFLYIPLAMQNCHDLKWRFLAVNNQELINREEQNRKISEAGGEAEELRRAFGFKRSEARMKDVEKKLRLGMERKGVSTKGQEEIIKAITSFALYGFPESHAASFALLAYASAYLKCYYLAAFTAAMLNNQPMGFYSAATVVKDAQRHGLRIKPVDVMFSEWSCTLETHANQICLRMGLRYVKGLRAEAAEAVVDARAQKPFASIDDLARRVPLLRKSELVMLGQVGALNWIGAENNWQFAEGGDKTPSPPAPLPQGGEGRHLSLPPAGGDAKQIRDAKQILDHNPRPLGGEGGPATRDRVRGLSVLHKPLVHRRDALWQVDRAVQPVGPLLESIDVTEVDREMERQPEEMKQSNSSPLAPMTTEERLVADFRGTGLTTGPHPMAYCREAMNALGVKRAGDLIHIPNNKTVRIAGGVIARQRPGTAKGFVFLSLEDETGVANAIVTPDLFEQYRFVLVTEQFLMIEGRLQNQDNVISVKAEVVYPVQITNAQTTSHDFH